MSSRRPFRRGFTQLDLLVVIAIIAILIGLLLPSEQEVAASTDHVSGFESLKSSNMPHIDALISVPRLLAHPIVLPPSTCNTSGSISGNQPSPLPDPMAPAPHMKRPNRRARRADGADEEPYDFSKDSPFQGVCRQLVKATRECGYSADVVTDVQNLLQKPRTTTAQIDRDEGRCEELWLQPLVKRMTDAIEGDAYCPKASLILCFLRLAICYHHVGYNIDGYDMWCFAKQLSKQTGVDLNTGAS